MYHTKYNDELLIATDVLSMTALDYILIYINILCRGYLIIILFSRAIWMLFRFLYLEHWSFIHSFIGEQSIIFNFIFHTVGSDQDILI